MLVPLSPITESRAYKEIFAEGKMEGMIEGKIKGEIKGRVKLLNDFLADGLIDEKTHAERMAPLLSELKRLETESKHSA